MNINIDLIKKIISSDDLCDKVNSSEYKNAYKEQIKKYVLFLVDDIINNKNFINISFVMRYIRKFVISENISKEDKFFDEVALKIYSLKINNEDLSIVLKDLNFYEIKELLFKKYNQIISNKMNVDDRTFCRMLIYYYYVCPNYVVAIDCVNYFLFNIINRKINFDCNIIGYIYKQVALSFSLSKNLSVTFSIEDSVMGSDPYYDVDKNKIIVYRQSIGSTIDYRVLSDIFFQVKYIYLLKSINNNKNNYYTYEQLQLVKEICLVTILGNDYFDDHYKDISFSNYLKKQANSDVYNYFRTIGIMVNDDFLIDYFDDFIKDDISVDNSVDKVISIDILFSNVIKKQNNNLIKELVRNYPILGCEYKSDKKKNLIDLLLDIYNNKKLLKNLNKDLQWYFEKRQDDQFVNSKIEKLKNKISICSSYIEVMNSIINNNDMTSDDIVNSINGLISYSAKGLDIQNDICLILNVVIPKKIRRLCEGRDNEYITDFKKKVIICYLDSMNKKKEDVDMVYFMKIYSSLENVVNSFDINSVKVA